MKSLSVIIQMKVTEKYFPVYFSDKIIFEIFPLVQLENSLEIEELQASFLSYL